MPFPNCVVVWCRCGRNFWPGLFHSGVRRQQPRGLGLAPVPRILIRAGRIRPSPLRGRRCRACPKPLQAFGILQGMTDAPNEVIPRHGKPYPRWPGDTALFVLRSRRSHPFRLSLGGAHPCVARLCLAGKCHVPGWFYAAGGTLSFGFLVGEDDGLLGFITGVVTPVGLHEHGVDLGQPDGFG